MDVLYDVTNLGRGFGTDLSRTGIFRATEQFIRAALAGGEVEARFAAIASYAGEVQLARFDRSVGGLLDGRIIPAWISGESLATSIDLVGRLLAADPAGAEGKRLSAEVRLLNRAARPRPIPQWFDVYHSLRQPLAAPDRVRARARVVTIYDMIPFLFPELTEDRFVEEHRAVIGAIDAARDWIVCSSACTKADICALTSVSPHRVFVTPFAAARDIFHVEPDGERVAAVRNRHGLGDRPYLLSLCTLEPRKNLARLVRAFFALVADRRWRDLRLALVGPTGWKAEALFASLAEQPALRGQVVLTGYVPDADLSALYSGARAFVFPSLYEGFGLPALEAMQCGVPVIASRAGSLPEVVGEAALTVDPTDEASLTAAMAELLENGERAADLGRRGLERSREFTWARTVRETVRAYRVMLSAS